MRRMAQGYTLLFWMGVGIVAATLISNRLFASGLVSVQVLYQRVAQDWQSRLSDGSGGDLRVTLQILTVRLAETAAVAFLCHRAARRGRRTGLYLLLAGMGAVTGLSIVVLTWSRGVAGIFCCLASWLPQNLFYLMAWGILILQAMAGYEIRRGRFWPAVGFLIAVGVLSEIWINPFFLRFV